MEKLPIPESALDGTAYTNPTGPGVTAGYISPLAIPTAPPLSPQPAADSGPSVQKSLYEYPYAGSK